MMLFCEKFYNIFMKNYVFKKYYKKKYKKMN